MASQAIVSSVGNAIASQEGYGQSATNKPTRTFNPGDLGNDDAGNTKAYASQEAGYDALYKQVGSMFDGTSKIYNPDMTLAQVGSHYASGKGWADGVANKLGIPVNTKLSDIASGAVPIKMVEQPQSVGSSGGNESVPSGHDLNNLTVDNTNPPEALPVSGMGIPADQIDAINNAIAPSLIIDSGLNQLSWYDDDSILQVNRPTFDAVGSPVSFQIFFQDGSAPLPVSIQLMASVRTHQKSMRHVMTKQKTRTGVLVNLWGMATDSISGSASTGLMANQLGVTDFLSLSTASDAVKQKALQAYQSSDMVASDVIESMMAQQGFFRVAAKDAFVEFLSMFKNNGNVWFRNEGYTGVTTEMQQTGIEAWSPVTGSSTFQNAARRNDVMTRGRVVMYFRNAQYSGYFKSLNWVMDAKNPFRWNFNFVFQVEQTHLNVGVPLL